MRALAKLRDQHVDGLILLTNHLDDGRLAAGLADGFPVVLLDEDVAGRPGRRGCLPITGLAAVWRRSI